MRLIFALFIAPFSRKSSLDLFMRLTPTTNKCSLIWHWIYSGLLSVVGYGYVRHFLWEQLLLNTGNYFVIGLRESTMKKLLASDNSRDDLLYTA